MTLLAEAIFQQSGFVMDPAGNYNPPPEIPAQAAPTAAPAPAPAPRSAVAPAQAVKPVKATAPEVDIPEPPVVGQASPADVAATKKKTLLGG